MCAEVEEAERPPCGIRCSIMYSEEKLEWFFETKGEDNEDNNNSLNYDAFISFLSQKTGISDVASMDIYHIDNESDATSCGSVIDHYDDFGEHFDEDDEDDETRYFKVKLKSSFQVKINLNEADCKEEIVMTIGQHGFDDSKEEEWFHSWQDMSNKIGNTLNDSNWESKYSLCDTKRDSVVKVSDFVNVFKNFAADGGKSIELSVRVKCFLMVFFGFFKIFFLFFMNVKNVNRHQQVTLQQRKCF